MKKGHFEIVFALLLFLTIFSSCQSLKHLTYFQKQPNQLDTIKTTTALASTIQPGDILSIFINSLSPTASAIFNPYGERTTTTNTVGSGSRALSSSESPGYLVDQAGNIELPLVGSLSLGGLTTLQAKEMIKKRLDTYLKEPTVNVRILNYKITMLGEVQQPSVYVIPNERVTLTEAIGMAGDLTPLGRRDNIMIVREVNGEKQVGYVNLNDRSVFTSPYYYLRSNDLIYVESVPGKAIQNSTFFRVMPIVLSVTTFLVLIITRVF